MLIWYWQIHDLGKDPPALAGLLLLRLDDMAWNRLVHRLDHIGDIRSQVRAKGRHQADGVSEDWNMAEDMTGGNQHFKCPLVVLLEVGSVQES